jgi:hypothetical protein
MTTNIEKEKSVLLELGDIIKIIDPQNEVLNQNIFLIDYIDTNRLQLLNTDTFEKINLTRSEEGVLGNGTIEQLIILSRSPQKGYAKQNGLISGVFIDIHFGGDYPAILSGEITNLENDMIEIRTIDSDTIYINFDYKGIPEDLPIELIEIREKPSKKITPPDDLEISEEMIEETSPKDSLQLSDLQSEKDELEKIDIQVPITNVRNQLREFLIKGDQIKFMEEELGPVAQFKDVDIEKERYSIETQLNDLLEDLLSNIPDFQRTNKVLNNIHTIIDRFKQLRTQFSIFDQFENVESKLVFEANYKPLVKYFEEFKLNLYWILPIVKNIKKVYNIDISSSENETNDYINIHLNHDLNKINDIISAYKSNDFPNEQNKYSQLYSELNAYFTPFENVNTEEKGFLIEKRVNANINCIVNNLEDMYSTVFSQNNLKNRRFLIQKYNLGLTKIEPTDDGKNVLSVPLTSSDIMTISSILTLPEPTIRFSKINLPCTTLLDKAHLNTIFLNYWEFLKTNTKIKNIFVEDLNQTILFNEKNYANNFKNYILNSNQPSSEETYKQFIQKIIPKTRIVFDLMKQFIKGKLSIVDVVGYLEPFLIYTDNITYKQFEDIANFIEGQISTFNKELIEKSKLFFSIKNLKSNPVIKTSAYTIIYNIKSSTYQEEVFDGYDITVNEAEINYTNSEILKKLITTDNNRYYCSMISKQTIPLMIPNEFNELYTEEDNPDKNKKLDEIKKECTTLKIAKSYENISELRNDDNITIYYDKRFDNTDYHILDSYENQLLNMTPEAFSGFLSKEIQYKLKLSEGESFQLVETILTGHKKVQEGDHAFILGPNIEKDDEIDFYIRKNNTWVLDKEVSNEMLNIDKNISCNFKLNCIAENDKCGTMEMNKFELKQKLLKDMTNEFDTNYFKLQENLKQLIEKDFDYRGHIITQLRKLELIKILKYNDEKYNMTINFDEKKGDQLTSPNSKLLFLILMQGDFIKVQFDIIRFVQKFTRNPITVGMGPLNKKESPAWLYCKETNLPLLPIFKYTLATEYVTNQSNYNIKLDLLISEIGKLSDDGNYWIDENSGWTIKKIEDDFEEGYDDGFKVVSRSIIEGDIGDKIIMENNITYITEESKMIINIINTISAAMGINLENQKEFIINSVSDALKNTVETEEDYKRKVKEMAAKNKKIISYNDLMNSSILYYTLGMILIAIQTAIPSIKTRKTYPGCIKSFRGFPFEGTGDLSSLEYITCIISDIKHSGEPWYVLKGKRNEVVFQKMKIVIENILLNLMDVKTKIVEKTEYLLLNKEEEILGEHNVAKWIQFLPPLVPFKITNITTLSNDFKNKLLNELKSGAKSQFEKILVIRGKMIKFSLAIQENIDKIVKKEGLLMLKQNQEPFLENACCTTNDKVRTLQFFINKNPEIGQLNTDVKGFSNYILDINSYSKSAILSSNINTKSIYPEITNQFSEEIIYLAFIYFCKFQSLYPIPNYLIPLCSNKPDELVLSENANIEEMIIKLKQDGRNYNTESFLRLIQLISRQNIKYYNINKTLITSVSKLSGFLEMLNDTNDDTIEPVFRSLMSNNIDTYEIGGNKISQETRNLNNYLQKSNESLKANIKSFILKNHSQKISKSQLKKIIICLDNISTWKNIEDEDDTIPNDMLYNIVNFYKQYITNFITVFPNLIQNEMNYRNNKIPDYMNLSGFHKKKIIDLIANYYSKLQIFYSTFDLNKVFYEIQRIGKNLIELSKITPVFTNFKNGEDTIYPILNQRTGIYLFEFYLLKSLQLFLDLSEDKNMIVFEVEKKYTEVELFTTEFMEDVNRKEDYIEPYKKDDSILINGSQKKLKEEVATLLSIYLEVFCEHKKIINYSYQDIQNNIFKLKEKEKDMITDRLKFLTDEQREADTILKINKLGVWNKGLQKGLTQYTKENYDDDREFRNEMEKIELQIRNNDSVNERNMDILIDDLIEERETDNMIEDEEYDMTNLNEDYYNDFEDED